MESNYTAADKRVDARFAVLERHCQAVFIARAITKADRKGAKEAGSQLAARLMPNFTDKAIASRAGISVAMLFPSYA